MVLNQKQLIDFSLEETASTLQEFVVRPGGINPAVIIMKRAKSGKRVQPRKIEYYEYDGYNKVQLAIDNVSDKFKKERYLVLWSRFSTPLAALVIALLKKCFLFSYLNR